MASSSSSVSNSFYWKCDVFLSFRGKDTRRNFTSHLYQGLKNRGIFTFLDDKRLENGDSISEELGKAIEVSQVAVTVFSRNYAMSRWCLNELVKIMECKEKENGQTVIPIFCDVDPSHVRYQSKSFEEAFAKHESRSQRPVGYLAKDLSWFGKGSRKIATTRDKRLIGENDVVFEVETLLDYDAIKLFNQYAFKEKVPNERFKYLTLEIVSHAKGHPLALKVWGSSLHRMDITEWESALVRIKKTSDVEITENLKISYDGLEPEEQEIFLDIACFFRGIEKEKVMQVLESCYSGLKIELRVLVNKSLVIISKNNEIEMHDLIQDMGKCIVQMQKHPGEYSRLWNVKDFKEVIDNNMGTMAVEAICFTYFEELSFNKEAMKNMKMLRILCLCNGDEKNKTTYSFSSDSNCHDGSIEYLSNNLRWFVWHHYPWQLLPEYFNPKRLVHLDLRWSSLHYLWNETKEKLPSLRFLDLRGSKNMKRTPDFKAMPNLEYLDLRECRSLEEFTEFLGIMKPELKIKMSYSGIRELPLSIIHPQAHLTNLHLHGLKNLVSLPSSICKLKGLVRLNVSECSKLERLPEEIGDLENLESLAAHFTLISRPPSSIVRLNKLKSLTFYKEKSEDIVNFVFPQMSEGLRSLEYLDLRYCNIIDGGLPEDIGSLSSLEVLKLGGNNFEYLPRSIAQLGALQTLNLSHCMRLTQLPEFPQQLNTIAADWSNDLICNSLFQNISSLQHDICTSDSLSLRVFTTEGGDILRWFHHREDGTSIFVKLPKNWYVSENFLGFSVCFSGQFIDGIAHLFCYHGRPVTCIAQKLALSIHSEYRFFPAIHCFLVPHTGLLDKLKANGKTPNDYGCIKLTFPEEVKECGLRLLYKHHDSVTRICRIL
ncbi:hypothetical protein KY289_007284 [Solanum tuberosum]|nr:hypothetical protein KY289_007284 [Solanum tuberosum]